MSEKTRDRFYARLSFFLGLGFWIPLLNFPLSILSIIFGISALRLAHLYPQRYGGRVYAIIGIILSSLPIIFGISALIIPSTRQLIIEELMLKNFTLLK
jgi:hypothetical protein